MAQLTEAEAKLEAALDDAEGSKSALLLEGDARADAETKAAELESELQQVSEDLAAERSEGARLQELLEQVGPGVGLGEIGLE